MNRAFHHVATMCRVLDVSPSGYYAWRKREVSAREADDARLCASIRRAHSASRGTYGRPRIHADLVDEGWRVGGKRVARLMRAEGVRGVTRRKGAVTTVPGDERRPHPDRVERDFTATAPDQLYVADITYIPTWTGFLYLAIVLDVFSRRIVGWRMATHLRTELVAGALDMALWQRRPADVIHHSDQGCQYTSIDFGDRCRHAGVRPSMGSVGDCYDNAMAESFFATLECELIDGCQFRDPDEARREVFTFIEGWYNPHRRHSAIRYISPIQYEKQYAQATVLPKPVPVH